MLPSIHLWGNFTLYTYPFLVGIAIGLAIFLLDQLQIKLDKWKIIILPIMWIGAKLAFILTAGSQYYQYLGSSDFWLGGGLVFYGAFISLSIYLFILW